MKTLVIRSLFAAAAMLPFAPFAAEPPAPAAPTVPSVADTLNAWGLSVNGYVATSYYGSNGYPSNIHEFDIQHNTFQLDQAGLIVAYQPKSGFGALVDAIAGEDARILNASESGSSDRSVFDLRQAFLQYATGSLTIIAGKYLTLAGAEYINPTQNTNFSRSLIFTWCEPLTHTGLRGTWALSDSFSVIGGVNNGWNVMSTSYGSKTAELGLVWTPSKSFSLGTQAYVGKVQQYDGERVLIDVVATYNATAALTLVLNVDWDQQQFATGPSASWNGAALYVNYAINDAWRFSVRGEYLDDKDGFNFGGGGQTIKEGTVTLGYAPLKNCELRLEARYDKAQQAFLYRSDPTAPNPELADNLSQIALQGVYKFGT
jgi:hypothetical protein